MHAHRRLDLRKHFDPLSLLEFMSRLQDMVRGETLEVLIGNHETSEDLKKIIDRSEHQIMSIKKVRDFYKFLIKKGG